MMKWFFKFVSIVILMLCIGLQVKPGNMMVEKRVDMSMEKTVHFSDLKDTFTANDLSAVYDFLEKSFILAEQTDLPEDVGARKGRWSFPVERSTVGKAALKCHRVLSDEAVCKFLSAKYIQGFYIYWINKLII